MERLESIDTKKYYAGIYKINDYNYKIVSLIKLTGELDSIDYQSEFDAMEEYNLIQDSIAESEICGYQKLTEDELYHIAHDSNEEIQNRVDAIRELDNRQGYTPMASMSNEEILKDFLNQ